MRIPQTPTALRTVPAAPASGIHVVVWRALHRALGIGVDALLVWVLGRPILGKLSTLQCESCDPVAQVVHLGHLRHGLLDGRDGGHLEQKLLLLGVLQAGKRQCQEYLLAISIKYALWRLP